MRHILISDIHGCCRQFQELLDVVNYNDDDQLILCGDLFDRGPDSYGVYEEIRKQTEIRGLPPIIIRGNHEQMLFDVNTDVSGKLGRHWYNVRLWYVNGGMETEASFKKNKSNLSMAARFLKKQSVFSYETERFITVHGDPRDLDSPHSCLWDTWSVDHNDYKGKLAIVGHTPLPSPVYCDGSGCEESPELPYGEWLDLPKTGLICIDTAGVFGGAFTAAVIEDQRIRFERVKGYKR